MAARTSHERQSGPASVVKLRSGPWSWLVENWPRSAFWRLLVFIPGAVLLVVPLVANEDAPKVRLLSAGLGLAALILPAWMSIYVTISDKRRVALSARDEVLEPLTLERPDGASPSSLLWARWSTSKFYGRRDAKRALDAWLKSSRPLLIIEGGAQVGKKRLALDWSATVGGAWITGWLAAGHGAGAVERIASAAQDTIVVVDGHASQLSEFVTALGQHTGHPDQSARARSACHRHPRRGALRHDGHHCCGANPPRCPRRAGGSIALV